MVQYIRLFHPQISKNRKTIYSPKSMAKKAFDKEITF